MSSLLNKAMDAMKPKNDPAGTQGPHSTHAGNVADPDNSAGTLGHNTGTLGQNTSTLGHNTGTMGHNPVGHGSAPTTAGPHETDMANRLDPRVDSDKDNSTTIGSGTGIGGYSSGTNRTAPHQSGVLNTLDPRVDSDSHRGTGTTGLGGNTHHSDTLGSGLGGHSSHRGTGTTGLGGNTDTLGSGLGSHGSSNLGPHQSNVMNRVDPRVDSDGDGSNLTSGQPLHHSHAPGVGKPSDNSHPFGTGATGTTGNTGSVGGLHSSHTPHDLNPRGGSGVGVGTSSLPGPADSTAGPHKSNLANKLDPRVDSDMDGSKTFGGDKTFS